MAPLHARNANSVSLTTPGPNGEEKSVDASLGPYASKDRWQRFSPLGSLAARSVPVSKGGLPSPEENESWLADGDLGGAKSSAAGSGQVDDPELVAAAAQRDP